MGTPEWAKAIEVDAVIETWDGLYAETERELIRLAPIHLGTVTLSAIWGKLSEDARENLWEIIDTRAN
ncbi:hypothetical protein LCGC14_2212660 [marine sediment metagenome]|uniref:Uncharacterized protein n=1 Tax=marine sediment metagenome TaxID=412755 RepID=A0A0F9E0T0_9ZZZZ